MKKSCCREMMRSDSIRRDFMVHLKVLGDAMGWWWMEKIVQLQRNIIELIHRDSSSCSLVSDFSMFVEGRTAFFACRHVLFLAQGLQSLSLSTEQNVVVVPGL